MKNLHKTEYHYGLVLFRFFPVIGTILTTALVGVLLMTPNHINIVIEDNIAGNSLMGVMILLFLLFTGLLLVLSDALGFCKLHKMLLCYMVLVGLCVGYEHFIGFGSYLFTSRLVVFCLGCLLLLCLAVNWKRFSRC